MTLPRRWLLLGLLLALGALLGWRGPEVWWWATHERVYYHGRIIDDAICYGYYTISRASGQKDGPARYWNAETGFLATERLWFAERGADEYPDATLYTPLGEVTIQARGDSTARERRAKPPWWGAVTDQTAPSAPWIKQGIPADEWWERVRAGE